MTIPDMPGGPAAAPAANAENYPDGTIIANDAGQQMIMQNGEWVVFNGQPS